MVSGTQALSLFRLSSTMSVPILSVTSGYSIDAASSPSGKKKWFEKGVLYCFKGNFQKLHSMLLLILTGPKQSCGQIYLIHKGEVLENVDLIEDIQVPS